MDKSNPYAVAMKSVRGYFNGLKEEFELSPLTPEEKPTSSSSNRLVSPRPSKAGRSASPRNRSNARDRTRTRSRATSSAREQRELKKQFRAQREGRLKKAAASGGTIFLFMEGYEFNLYPEQCEELDLVYEQNLIARTRLIAWESGRPIAEQIKQLWELKESPDTLGFPILFFLNKGKWAGTERLQESVLKFFRSTDWRAGDSCKAKHMKAKGYLDATIVKSYRHKKYDLEFADKQTLMRLWGKHSWRRMKCPREDIKARAVNCIVGLATPYPLMFASRNDLPDTTKCLLQCSFFMFGKMNVNHQDPDGNTALHVAPSVRMLRTLISANGDVSIQNGKGYTVLQVAASSGRRDIVEELLASETKLEGTNDALRLAAKFNQLSVLAALLKSPSVDVNAIDTGSRSSLIFAAREGHLDVVKYLLAMQADVNHSDKYGQTPLVWASAEGKADVVSVLLDANADKEAEDNEGQTPLIWAASEGRNQCVEILLEYSANIQCVDAEYGRTPLMRAVMENQTDTAMLLVEYKAKLEDKDAAGRTAFMLATEFGNQRTVRTLLDMKADLEGVDEEGSTSLILAAKRGALDTVKLLMRAGADMELMDKFGWTTLMWAGKKGHTTVVDYLLNCKANVNATCRGSTVLMRAAAEGHEQTVVLIIAAKAEIDARDQSEGHTALMKAARGGHLEVVSALLMAGANATMQDDNKDTAWSLAKVRGRKEVAKVLEEFQFGERRTSASSGQSHNKSNGGAFRAMQRSLQLKRKGRTLISASATASPHIDNELPMK